MTIVCQTIMTSGLVNKVCGRGKIIYILDGTNVELNRTMLDFINAILT